MRIASTGSKASVLLSRSDWERIGNASGWLEKASASADFIDSQGEKIQLGSWYILKNKSTKNIFSGGELFLQYGEDGEGSEGVMCCDNPKNACLVSGDYLLTVGYRWSRDWVAKKRDDLVSCPTTTRLASRLLEKTATWANEVASRKDTSGERLYARDRYYLQHKRDGRFLTGGSLHAPELSDDPKVAALFDGDRLRYMDYDWTQNWTAIKKRPALFDWEAMKPTDAPTPPL